MSRFTRFAIVFGTIFMMAAVASAADVRLGTLGGGNAVYGNFWNDAGDADFWYGEMDAYANTVWLNFDDTDGGVNSMAFSKSEEGWGSYYLGYDGSNTNSKITVGYGYALEMATLGVYFDMFNGDYTAEGDTEVTQAMDYTFGFGADYDMNGTNIDFAFAYASDAETEGTAMGFGVRAFYAWKDGVDVIPVFLYSNAEVDEEAWNDMAVALGFAYTVNEDNSLIFGLSYISDKYDDGTEGGDTAATTMPGFYAGVEHDLFDWLTVRFSGSKDWTETTTGDLDPVESYGWGWGFGFGAHVGDFDLDVSFDESTLLTLPNWWVGGDDTPGFLTAQILYHF